jgi:hypothetical protein
VAGLLEFPLPAAQESVVWAPRVGPQGGWRAGAVGLRMGSTFWSVAFAISLISGAEDGSSPLPGWYGVHTSSSAWVRLPAGVAGVAPEAAASVDAIAERCGPQFLI